VNVVIAGSGRVGILLATRLSLGGHRVSVIDQDRVALSRLGAGLSGAAVLGKAFDRDALEAAGIQRADAFCAVTSGDNSNIVSAKIAREVYRVPRVDARIYDPRRADIYRRLGITAVSSVSWSVNEISALLLHPQLHNETVFGDGEVRLVTVEVPNALDGRLVNLLTRPGLISVVARVRSGVSTIPTAGATLSAGDLLYVAVANEALPDLERMLEP